MFRLILSFAFLWLLPASPSGELGSTQPLKTTAPMAQEIIVVYQADKDAFFVKESLPKLREFAKSKGIRIIERQAMEGVPSEITTTPSIIYQNYKGRSVYAARYASFSSIVNFVRTARFVPQAAASNCKKEVFSWQEGRARIVAPIKITDLGGDVASDFDQGAFQQKALTAIGTTLEKFKQQPEVCLQRTDRAFYFDFHPYKGSDGRFFLSYELFSQFSCIEPVFSSQSEPLTADFANFEEAFADAAGRLEKEVARQLTESTIGDAVTPISAEVASGQWDDFGLKLPAAPALATEGATEVRFPEKWAFAGPVDEDTPALQFHFKAPLDRYAGEVRQLKGQMQMDPANGQMNGRFEVATQSLTMGMPDLDIKVLKKYIKAFRYPKSSFEFQLGADASALSLGQVVNRTVPGTFELMNKRKPITVNASFSPTLDDEGQPLLLVQAGFEMNITNDFGIDGPDGPSPAKETVLCNLVFYMKPA